ncbi:MAG: NADH-ubiquinone oxidoreductase-F iron-sulfur binding region domain-containing protein [Bacillota bacterium]
MKTPHLITEPSPTARERLAEYRARGGYAGLARARAEGGRWALEQVHLAGLRGRGGSGKGAPVAEKWRKVARAAGIAKYVIGNGAESSPVSRKDRYLLTYFPHRVLEGLLIACAAVGADQAYLFVRGDAEEALAAVEAALEEAREAGLLGAVAVELQPSAPSYISGEETAVIDSLEGLEGLPQPKPPYPEEIGLRGCPTVLNNVETLAAAAAILRLGVEGFRALGTPDCPGTALFTVTGAVGRPGVYEVPYGTRLDELLARAGAPAAEQLLAVLPGGLSSGPLRPDELHLPLTYEALAEAGTSIGPAAIVVFARAEASLSAVVRETVTFLTEASCGQCHGCKEGHRQLAGALQAGETGLARELATVLLYGRGNCGHPTGTARLALRALQAFPESDWQ